LTTFSNIHPGERSTVSINSIIMPKIIDDAWAAIDGMKYLLFAINFLIWSLGAGLLAVAIWVRGDGELWEYVQALPIKHYYYACYIAMAIGVLLLVFGFIGCLGAATESPCLIVMYLAVTIACVVLEVTACVLIWRVAGGDELQAVLSKDIMYHVENRIYSDSSRRFLDLIQLHLGCCGAESYVDYRKLGQDIPASCNSDRTNNVYIRSCGEMLRRNLEVRGAFIGGLSVSLLLMQMMAILFNSCLYSILKKEDDRKVLVYRH